MPGYLKRNYVSEDMLRSFFAHVLSPKNVLFNWLVVRSSDVLHERAVRRYNDIMGMPRNGKYDAELDFLQNHPLHAGMFPYERLYASNMFETGIEKGLPYVCHKDKKLFFPRKWAVVFAESEYRTLIEEEGLLGTGHLRKSPHSYVTDTFKVEAGDVVLDVGSAEGLFALDNIELAAKVYVFESLKCWFRPLMATFGPFKDKVRIINKYVGSELSRTSTTLSDVLKCEDENAKYFIKMDIEGAERDVLLASEDFLRNHQVKLACAAYHRQDDADYLKEKLESMGFMVRFSDGYMIPQINDFIYPYFRRGMIYAQNFKDQSTVNHHSHY